MKAKITRLLPLFALFIFTKTLCGQQLEMTTLPVKTDVVADPSGINKIVIHFISKDENGKPESGLIVLKGEAAGKFDLKKWLVENSENTSTDIEIEKLDGTENIFKFKKAGLNGEKRRLVICGDAENPRGFLGVMPADENETADGLPVEIVPESAAAEAGMVENDVLLSLNDSKIDTWNDLTQFMKSTKPGDEIKITFRHDSQTASKTVKLGTQKSEPKQPFGWAGGEERWGNNVRNHKRDHENWPKKEACLGVYGATNSQISPENSLLDGAKITSFVKEGAAEPAGILVNDIITAIDGSPVKTYNELYKTIAEYQPGDKVKVSFQRGEEKKNLEIVLQACEPRRVREVVIIKEVPMPKSAQPIENQPIAQPGASNQLALESFSTFPNPTKGRFTMQFKSEPGPTVVRLIDVNGRVVFSEEINSFDGFYEQEFDLREAAKGTILVSVSQGEKIFTSQLILN